MSVIPMDKGVLLMVASSTPTPGRDSGQASTASPPARLSSRERAVLCARTAADNRAQDVIILDMTNIVKWTDYLVICTGASRRQLCAIADDVERAMEEQGDHKIGVEGYEKGDWIVVDFADIVLHAFSPEKREYYEVEHLWGDAPRVEWERSPA